MKLQFLGELAEVTPSGFRFTLIIHNKIIREIHLGSFLSLPLFLQSIRALQQFTKLGCLVAQIPRSLLRETELINLLEGLRKTFHRVPLVVEFPHSAWVPEMALQSLHEQGMGIVFVDEPQTLRLPEKIAPVTSNLAYMRFQGRFHRHRLERSQERPYEGGLYSVEDFKEWLARIKDWRDQSDDLYIFVKGVCPARAALDAWKLRILLEDALENHGEPRRKPTARCPEGVRQWGMEPEAFHSVCCAGVNCNL